MTGFQNSTSCKNWPQTSAECKKWWLKCKIFSADAAKLGGPPGDFSAWSLFFQMVRSTLCQQKLLAGLRLDFCIRSPDIEDSAYESNFSQHIKIDVISRIASPNGFLQRIYSLNLNCGSNLCIEKFGPV